MSNLTNLKYNLQEIESYHNGRPPTLTRKQITEALGREKTWNKELTGAAARVPKKRGVYKLDWSVLGDTEKSHSGELVAPEAPVAAVEVDTPKSSLGESVESVSFIPDVDATYRQFGHHRTIESIVKSDMFYPTFVTGLSGNGKTFMIEQVCAKLKKECIRVNLTIETDEDDLLGGFRLVNGETVFHKGPVVDAMERGAVLLLDEIDLASNKILCLQPVLEGKGVYLKKINQWVKPAKGFNVLATANTKGKGSETGAFVGKQILNVAILDRFAITIEQDYATPSVEKKILLGHMAEFDKIDDEFATKLTFWADAIRKTYMDGGIDEIISTRRLVHIVKAYSIFDDRMKAIELCVNRFDEETKTTFIDTYTKFDEDVDYDPTARELLEQVADPEPF